MTKGAQDPVVLAVHPTSKGFGWIVFRGSGTPIDWGLASAKSRRPARLEARFRRILERHEPALLVLEAFEDTSRVDRIKAFCREIRHLAECRGTKVCVLSAYTVQEHFARSGGTTRYEIARAIANHLDALTHRLPPKRRAWMSQDPRRSLFDAAALAITYFAASARGRTNSRNSPPAPSDSKR